MLTLDADGRPLVDIGRSVAPDPDDPPVSSQGWAAVARPSRFVDHCLGEHADRQQPYLFLGSPIDSLGDSLVDAARVSWMAPRSSTGGSCSAWSAATWPSGR